MSGRDAEEQCEYRLLRNTSREGTARVSPKHRLDDGQTPPREADGGRSYFDLEPGRWYVLRCTTSEGLTFDFRDQYIDRSAHTLHFKSHTINTQATRVEEATPV